MSVITILDFEKGTINIHPFNDDDTLLHDGIEEFFEKNGYNENNCQWLITDKLNLTIHELKL